MSHSLQPHGMPMEFTRQEYRSGLPFPSPGDCPDLGIRRRDQTQVFCIAGRSFTNWAIIVCSLESNFMGRIKKLCSISCLLLVPMPSSRHVLGSGFSSKISGFLRLLPWCSGSCRGGSWREKQSDTSLKSSVAEIASNTHYPFLRRHRFFTWTQNYREEWMHLAASLQLGVARI